MSESEVNNDDFLEPARIEELEFIKKDFMEKFRKLGKNENLSMKLERDEPEPYFLGADIRIMDWRSKKMRKMMTLYEPMTESIFDFAAYTRGLRYHDDDDNGFVVMCRDSNLNVELIFDLYKKWFVEDISWEEMEEIAEKLNRELKSYKTIVLQIYHGIVGKFRYWFFGRYY